MKYLITLSLLFIAGIAFSQRVAVDHKEADQRVDIRIGGKPFTTYYYPGPELIKKPVLYPVYSPGGKIVTRGWPLDPRAGERVDHPHHIGVWFNYEDVNGIDFWNNSLQANRPGKKYGTILNTRVLETKSGAKSGGLTSTSDWVDPNGNILLVDTTHIRIHSRGKNIYIVDYEVILNAPRQAVHFKDVKDGMFAIRLARELELKYDEPQVLTGVDGQVRTEKIIENEKVTGSYRNKEGIRDDEVWGKSSAWCAMAGQIDGEKVTVAIFDHPSNVGYPGYWHARGYGLFALNSIARQAFAKEATPVNFKLEEGETARFRYRLVIASESLSDKKLRVLESEFAK